MRKTKFTIFLVIVFLGFFYAFGFANAAPAITGITGTLSNGSTVTITGSGFGTNGPTVALYDSFSGGTTGQIIPLNSPSVGSWTSYYTRQPVYDETAHSGSHSMQIFDGRYSTSEQQLRKVFTIPVTEVFVSYWVRIPDGTTFPGTTSTLTLPALSAWKFAWIMDTETGYGGDDDLCLPTYIGVGGITYLSGNDYGTNATFGISWWSWTKWMRLSFWLKANPSDPTLNGNIYFQALTEGTGQYTASWSDKPLFDNDTISPLGYVNESLPHQWDRIYFPGWLKPENSGSSRPVYDDIYVAAGSNSQARIEIGNASTYTASTNMTIVTPSSWSDTSIQATIRQGSFADFNNTYLYVIDANGNVNTDGFLLSSAPAPDTTPPSAPSGLVVI